jgi:large subunit ribosomal protein L4
MQVKLYQQTGEEIGTTELPSAFFEVPMNADLVHQVVQAQIANARHPIAHTKGRAEVRGGGRKPWRQKGTGRARHASIRSPIWKGGGVAFGPTKERNFSRRINKKMVRMALAMVFSSKAKDGELFLLDHLAFSEPKTKLGVAMLQKFITPRSSVVVITPQKDRRVERVLRNIPRTEVIAADSVNVRDMLAHRSIMMSRDAIPVLEKLYT